ncbi:hypothetical protein H4R33_000496 [Dimargaris cristalligena]|nr:hypothetical protein H4R33_000496 [Dimargaris cristalligena]
MRIDQSSDLYLNLDVPWGFDLQQVVDQVAQALSSPPLTSPALNKPDPTSQAGTLPGLEWSPVQLLLLGKGLQHLYRDDPKSLLPDSAEYTRLVQLLVNKEHVLTEPQFGVALVAAHSFSPDSSLSLSVHRFPRFACKTLRQQDYEALIWVASFTNLETLALEVYREIKTCCSGVFTEPMYLALLHLCGHRQRGTWIEALYQDYNRQSLPPSSTLLTEFLIALGLHSQGGGPEQLRAALQDQLPNLSTISATRLLASHLLSNDFHQFQGLYQSMLPFLNSQSADPILQVVLEAAVKFDQVPLLRAAEEGMGRVGGTCDPNTKARFVYAYSQLELASQVDQYSQELMDHPAPLTSLSWERLVCALASYNRLVQAETALAKMRQLGHMPSATVWVTLIRSALQYQDRDTYYNFHNQLRVLPEVPRSPELRALEIQYYVDKHQIMGALICFDHLRREVQQVDPQLYTILLASLARIAWLPETMDLLADMLVRDLTPSLTSIDESLALAQSLHAEADVIRLRALRTRLYPDSLENPLTSPPARFRAMPHLSFDV